MTPEQKLDIIEETRAFYNGHPERMGWDEHMLACMYHTPQGKCCAVGRHFPEGSPLGDFEGGYMALIDSEEYAPLIRQLTLFSDHDDDMFWNFLARAHDRAARELGQRYLPSPSFQEEVYEKFNAALDWLRDWVKKGEPF